MSLNIIIGSPVNKLNDLVIHALEQGRVVNAVKTVVIGKVTIVLAPAGRVYVKGIGRGLWCCGSRNSDVLDVIEGLRRLGFLTQVEYDTHMTVTQAERDLAEKKDDAKDAMNLLEPHGVKLTAKQKKQLGIE